MTNPTPAPGITPEERATIQERCEKATPPPWVQQIDDYGVIRTHPRGGTGTIICDVEGQTEIEAEANAEFIAHARADVPRLLREVERQATVIHEWEESDAAKGVLGPAFVEQIKALNSDRERLTIANAALEKRLAELPGKIAWHLIRELPHEVDVYSDGLTDKGIEKAWDEWDAHVRSLVAEAAAQQTKVKLEP
jgi:hypothetical protein